MHVIVLTSGYDGPEAVGPFESEDEAQDHLDRNIEVAEKASAWVVPVEDHRQEAV